MLAGFTAREAYVYTEPCSLSLAARLPSAAPDLARALDRAAADFFGNSFGGAFGCGGRAMGSASPPPDRNSSVHHAPPTIGPKILKAIEEVAPGSKIVALIYSHAHIDHIGYASEITKTNPEMKIVAHEETRKILARADDPARPLPTMTFDTQDQNFEFKVGNQTLQLQYPGPNHEPGNIGIYHPNQKVLMLVDIIFPGWIMWRRFAVSQDIPGYFNVVKTLNSRWD